MVLFIFVCRHNISSYRSQRHAQGAGQPASSLISAASTGCYTSGGNVTADDGVAWWRPGLWQQCSDNIQSQKTC